MEPIKLLQMLYAELMLRRTSIDKLSAYYDGAHPLAFTSTKFLEAFGGLFAAFSDNWCQLVVGACEERMQVQGFRAIGERTDDAALAEVVEADDDAARIWEMNDLGLQSQMGHTEALGFGAAYGVAWVGANDRAEITIESARDCIVARHPKFRNRVMAGLRVWNGHDEYTHAELFLADRVYLFRTGSKTEQLGAVTETRWVPEDSDEATEGLRLDVNASMVNPLKRVPVVEFLNRPRLTVSKKASWFAHSELTPIIPMQDAVNKMTADMLIASEFAAYPQRHVSRWQVDEDDQGNVIDPEFKNGPGSVWWSEGDANFGAFPAMDIAQYTKVIEMMVQHIASISSTPPHYLNGSADRLSGESLKSAETGLVSKVRRRMETFGNSWEELIRIAGAIEGIDRLKNAERMETIWKDPETRSEAEHVDAVLKKAAANVPEAQIFAELGYTPGQIKMFPIMRAQAELGSLAGTAARRLVAVPDPAAV